MGEDGPICKADPLKQELIVSLAVPKEGVVGEFFSGMFASSFPFLSVSCSLLT